MDLHVVSFQVPYPPSYGGIIDVYYKLKALKEAGAHITLHTYRYRCDEAPELSKVADTVYYYKRNTGCSSMLSNKPYIVYSRRSRALLRRLISDRKPILFEGLYTCLFLDHPALRDRLKIVRTHNVEHDYYRHLAAAGGESLWRRLYYRTESIKLRHYESMLRHADAILAITPADRDYFSSAYPDVNVHWVPCFHDDLTATGDTGTDPYILYHGNLSVDENVRAAGYIMNRIMPLTTGKYHFIFAGKNPSDTFAAKVKAAGAELIANPNHTTMDSLIARARINLLPTFQDTGIKLKLINALHLGNGHCLVNTPMLTDSALTGLCAVADTPAETIATINRLWGTPPSADALAARRHYLNTTYNNADNARKIIDLIG